MGGPFSNHSPLTQSIESEESKCLDHIAITPIDFMILPTLVMVEIDWESCQGEPNGGRTMVICGASNPISLLRSSWFSVNCFLISSGLSNARFLWSIV